MNQETEPTKPANKPVKPKKPGVIENILVFMMGFLFLTVFIFVPLSIIATAIMSITRGDTGIKVLWIEWYRYFTGTQTELDLFWGANIIALIISIPLAIGFTFDAMEQER